MTPKWIAQKVTLQITLHIEHCDYQTDKIAVYRACQPVCSSNRMTTVIYYTPDYLRGNCQMSEILVVD